MLTIEAKIKFANSTDIKLLRFEGYIWRAEISMHIEQHINSARLDKKIEISV